MATNEFLIDGLRFLQRNRGFLGREFLTWLWYTSETSKHKIKVDGFGEFKLFLDDKLVLSSSSGSVHENSLKGGTPGYAVEARTALQTGKMVQEAKFILQDGKRQWTWGMKADDLSVRSLRLPTIEESEPAAFILQRMRLVQTLLDVLDTLFKKYMSVRLTPAFAGEIENMTEWLHAKK